MPACRGNAGECAIGAQRHQRAFEAGHVAIVAAPAQGVEADAEALRGPLVTRAVLVSAGSTTATAVSQ